MAAATHRRFPHLAPSARGMRAWARQHARGPARALVRLPYRIPRLFSANELNYALTQLRIDEAAVLYRLLRSRRDPIVAELGRYKGGTAFLFAAAGARVLSLDNDASGGQRQFDRALELSLVRLGLRERVEITIADALAFPIGDRRFDLVLVHCNPTYEMAHSILDQWWPAVQPGGFLVFHDTPYLPGVGRLLGELLGRLPELGAEIERNVPGENVLLRKLGTDATGLQSAAADSGSIER